MTAPSPTLPFNLTARDREAIVAYERDCARTGEAPTDQGRAEWIEEWRELDDDERAEVMDAAWRERMTMAGFEP